MQRLVDQWGGSGSASVPGFNSYILQEILPLCFSALSQPHFDLKDAASLPLLEAIAAVQLSMLSKIGNEFLSYVCEHQLPALGASAESTRQVGRGAFTRGASVDAACRMSSVAATLVA